VKRVGLAEQLCGMLEVATLVIRIALAKQRERVFTILLRRLRCGNARGCDDHEHDDSTSAPHVSRILDRIMGESAIGTTDLPPRIGRHEVLAFLATGGMSELFLGRDPSGRVVVLKRILPHLARQTAFVSMFIDEARIGSLIHHKNVVEVFELGQVGTDLFMAMELLEGENAASLVRRLVRRNERFAYGLAAHLVAEASEGLHAAHELRDEAGQRLNLVHRDVSPQNVFVTYDGHVKVLDFGIAAGNHRLTRTSTGTLKGKFSYMSPEQCRGEPLDLRSDVFSLGIVLYEMTTQRRLFHRNNELLVLKAVCDEPIARPSRDQRDYPPFLEDICMRALSRDRAERYPSARAMRDDLIAAMQLLLGTTDPQKAMAEEMHRIFADRIETKRKMLRHMRAGTNPGTLPSLDADENVVVPEAAPGTPVNAKKATPDAVPQMMMDSLVSGAIEVTTSPAPRRRSSAFVSAVAVAAVVAGLIYVAMQKGGGATDAPRVERPPVAAEIAPSPRVAPAVVTPLPDGNPAKTELITWRIESTPPGAEVSIDGDVRGSTPLDVSLEPDHKSAWVEVRYKGYVTHRQNVARTKSRTMTVDLKKKKAEGGGGGGGGGGKPTKPADDGFHRFD
jgi:eukaryotic-like serine/threonine-protein kinase